MPPIANAASMTGLTIGMATYDDYDGVNFSVMVIRMFHPEVTADTEIVVVDQSSARMLCGRSEGA